MAARKTRRGRPCVGFPNSRQTSVMASPSRSRATKRRRSSITELAFHGIHTSRRTKAESVTHVSGTKCHLCLGPLIVRQVRSTSSWIVSLGDLKLVSRSMFGLSPLPSPAKMQRPPRKDRFTRSANAQRRFLSCDRLRPHLAYAYGCGSLCHAYLAIDCAPCGGPGYLSCAGSIRPGRMLLAGDRRGRS